MKLKIYTTDGASFTEKDFEGVPVFEDNRGKQALKEVVVAYQANLRQGNAKTKNRSEVRGTGKKVYRQKGTGMARHGDRQSPIYVGGGVAFGPRPRDYSKKINRKVKLLALQRAVYERTRDGGIDLIEAFAPSAPKTKVMNELLAKIEPKGKVLLVDDTFGDETILASRNIPRVFMVEADSINAWDLIRFDRVIASEKAFEQILQRTKADS